jgi:hypothetical protein
VELGGHFIIVARARDPAGNGLFRKSCVVFLMRELCKKVARRTHSDERAIVMGRIAVAVSVAIAALVHVL